MNLSTRHAILYLQAAALMLDDDRAKSRHVKFRLWALLDTSAEVRELLNRPVDKLLQEHAESLTVEDLHNAAAQLNASLYPSSQKQVA